MAKAKTEGRNIRDLLLKKRVLSRGNWRGRTGTPEAEFRGPRQERRKGHIKETALEHEQEGYRQELAVGDREPHKVGEINTEAHFRDRQSGFDRAISAAAPGLRAAFDSILRCPCEI